MRLEVTFRNLNARDEVRRRAQALYDKLERFLEPSAQGQLVIQVEHGNARVELVVKTHGQVHKAEEEDEDLRTALDRLFHRMEEQLRRAKGRRIDRSRRSTNGEGLADEIEPVVYDDEDDDDRIAEIAADV